MRIGGQCSFVCLRQRSHAQGTSVAASPALKLPRHSCEIALGFDCENVRSASDQLSGSGRTRVWSRHNTEGDQVRSYLIVTSSLDNFGLRASPLPISLAARAHLALSYYLIGAEGVGNLEGAPGTRELQGAAAGSFGLERQLNWRTPGERACARECVLAECEMLTVVFSFLLWIRVGETKTELLWLCKAQPGLVFERD